MMSEYMLKTVMKRTHHPASTMEGLKDFRQKYEKPGRRTYNFS